VRVSIVTISYNQGRFLRRALESVLAQDHADIEYIAVDPGSTDGSLEILDEYRSRLAHLIVEPDEGPAHGLNRGFERATGEVLAYVNADDELLPGAVAAAVRAFEADPSLDIVYGHGVIADEAGRTIRRIRSQAITPWLYVRGGANILQQAAFVRRSAFERVGGFNEANRTSWDAELFLDVVLAGGRVRVVDEMWGRFRIHEDSISGSGSLLEEYRRDRERLFAKVAGRPPASRDRLSFTVARLLKLVRDPVVLVWKVEDRIRPGATG
jgi:glycosyltransferase involved in cell wall biosynthesis